MDEKSNGFLIGGSIPLFSNRKKVKIARAQEVGARLQLDNARLQAEATVQSRYNEVLQLQEAMNRMIKKHSRTGPSHNHFYPLFHIRAITMYRTLFTSWLVVSEFAMVKSVPCVCQQLVASRT